MSQSVYASSEDDRPSEQAQSRWRWGVLLAVVLVTAVARVWVIRHCAEPDGDAKGHLGIARALLSDPLNVSIHWVWPPGYHYYLAGLLALGVTPDGIRLLDCALATTVPFLLLLYGERTLAPGPSRFARHAPFLAALLCALMPLVNLMGTSAQQETWFTILVLGAAWSIDAERFAQGGVLLAVAAMVRYEAFGAVGLLVGLRAAGYVPPLVRRFPAPIARACRLPLAVVLPSLIAFAAWCLAHRVQEGSWFGYLAEIHRFTHLQRESFHQDRFQDIFWFPVFQPWYVFGLTLPLFFLGLGRAWRTGWVVPLGIYGFLLASYLSNSALGSARYYESLTPFVCLSAAYGASVIGDRWRPAAPLAYAAALAHVARLLLLTGRWTFHL